MQISQIQLPPEARCTYGDGRAFGGGSNHLCGTLNRAGKNRLLGSLKVVSPANSNRRANLATSMTIWECERIPIFLVPSDVLTANSICRPSTFVTLSPRLLVRSNRSLPPLEFCRGVFPSQAANSRPDRNREGSRTVAAMLAPVNANTRYDRQQTADPALPMPSGEAPLDLPDLAVLPFSCSNNCLQDPETLWRNNAEFGHLSPQCIDQHRPLPDQQPASSMQHQNGLLLNVLYRYEPH